MIHIPCVKRKGSIQPYNDEPPTMAIHAIAGGSVLTTAVTICLQVHQTLATSVLHNEDIKNNAEQIALEVFGHTLYNCNAPLYISKMLYAQFVLKQAVEFA